MTTSNPGRRHLTSDLTYILSEPLQYDADVSKHPTYSDPTQGHVAQLLRNNISLPRSPLIGRDHELAAIQHLLLQEQVGLLTLTGPGGIGKTRLALQVAANLLDHFVDGVYFVSLAPISDLELVSATLAQTLGVREVVGQSLQVSLQAYLRDKELLLVLDNFEQIVAAAPLVGALLTACRRLKALVTSRATLHLYGEHEFLVPPLALPDAKHLASGATDLATSLAQVAAVVLFVQRARAGKADFVLTATNAATVAAICIALDGLPLAIELAAARIKSFSPTVLLARLNQRLTLLTNGPHDLPTRQRTLRDEIAWSYDLLPISEQTLFRRLAGFVDGFTLEAAQAVGHVDSELSIDVPDGIASLVDKSLLRQVEGPEDANRFDMLETIREFGLEQLAASGEGEAIRRQHLRFFLTLAEEADPKLRGSEQLIWLQRLESDYANLQAALAWSLRAEDRPNNRDRQQGLRLAGALSWFWHIRVRYNEGRRWCDQALALSDTTGGGPAQARALQGAGVAAQMQGDFAHAHLCLAESLALWQKLENRWGTAYTLTWLALAASVPGDQTTARPLAEASLRLFRALDDSWGIAFALNALGPVFNKIGDHATARSLLEESVMRFRLLGDAFGMADSIGELSGIAFDQGDYVAVRALIDEVQIILAVHPLLDNKFFRIGALHALGAIARLQADDQAATAFFEQSLTVARDVGAQWFVALAYQQLGFIAQQQGEDALAIKHFRASLNLAWALGRAQNIFSLIGCIAVAVYQQQWERAARLGGVVEILRASLERAFMPLQEADYERSTAAVRARRNEPLVAAAWAQGQAMTLEEGIAYALTPFPVTPALPVTTVALAKPAPELRLYALSAARVQRGKDPITASEWTYVKARELLFYLLCYPPRTREQLGLVFWPDASPTQLRNNLGVALHHLRRALGRREWIVFEDERYTFNRTLPYWFDLEVFEAHLTQARQHRASAPVIAITHLEQAVALNQGDFLEDFVAGDWYLPQRERVHKLYIEALLTLGELRYSAGQYEHAALAYQQAIARDEYLEAAHQKLIRCYARQGERGQALRHYQHLVAFMHKELNLPPDAETTALVDRLRRGEAI